jgi:hypothetical protein
LEIAFEAAAQIEAYSWPVYQDEQSNWQIPQTIKKGNFSELVNNLEA